MRELGVGLIARAVAEDDYDKYCEHLALAAKTGIPVAFSGETPQQIRETAALAVNAGMPAEAGLRGLTSGAARLTHMAEQTAVLAVGAPADLVVWTDSPLNLTARPIYVIVAGELVNSP